MRISSSRRLLAAFAAAASLPSSAPPMQTVAIDHLSISRISYIFTVP